MECEREYYNSFTRMIRWVDDGIFAMEEDKKEAVRDCEKYVPDEMNRGNELTSGMRAKGGLIFSPPHTNI